MPTNNKSLQNSLIQESPQWFEYWGAEPGIPDSAPIEGIDKPLDKEADRRKREELSGYYRDTIQPFNSQAHLSNDKNAAQPTEGLSKQGSVTDIYRVLWRKTIEPTEQPKSEKVEKGNPSDQPSKPINSEQTTTKPKLQKPQDSTEADLQQLLKDMNKILQRIKETEEENPDLLHQNLHIADPKLFRKLIETILQQKTSREESMLLSQDRLFKLQEVRKSLTKMMQEIREKQIKAREVASVTDWAGIGLTIGAAALFVGGILATIFTGGAALPAAVAAGSGLVTVASGVNSGVGGYYNYKSNEHEKELFGVRVQRDQHHTSIKDELHKHKESIEWATKQFGFLRQVSKSRQEASRFTI